MRYTKEMYEPIIWEEIEILDISDYVKANLASAGINTIANLVTFPYGEWDTPNIGLRTWEKIAQALSKHDLCLRMSRDSLLLPDIKQKLLNEFNERQMEAAGMPTPRTGPKPSPQPHRRRGYWRTMSHPRFRNHPKYGEKIYVKPSFVGQGRIFMAEWQNSNIDKFFP